MKRLKFYVDPKEFGEDADHVARILQETHTEVGIGVGATKHTTKPSTPEEKAKLTQVENAANRLLVQRRAREAVAAPSAEK